jgi:hypothetical protein
MERIDSKKDELCCKMTLSHQCREAWRCPQGLWQQMYRVEAVGEGGRRGEGQGGEGQEGGGGGVAKNFAGGGVCLAKILPSVGCNWF